MYIDEFLFVIMCELAVVMGLLICLLKKPLFPSDHEHNTN